MGDAPAGFEWAEDKMFSARFSMNNTYTARKRHIAMPAGAVVQFGDLLYNEATQELMRITRLVATLERGVHGHAADRISIGDIITVIAAAQEGVPMAPRPFGSS